MIQPRAVSARNVLRVTHIITGLEVGGAETMLSRLISAQGASVESDVICLSVAGPMAERLRALGTRVEVLGLPPGVRALLGIRRLVRALRARRPHLVHTWLYHADLLGGLAAKYCGIPVVWGLHNSTLDPQRLGHTTIWMIRALASLSRSVPTRIVSCSEVGLRAHQAGGYDAKRMLVIQNGFDTEQFRPSVEFREQARREWGYTGDELVVGLVARFNPLKDHQTFLAAAGLAAKREPRLRFVLYGDNVHQGNSVLMRWATAAQVREQCQFLGPDAAVERRLPGLDLLVSSSTSEAFPLILGEAMACGVLCVTTDVGDSGAIVGDAERIVPKSDPAALADAIVRAVQLDSRVRDQQVMSGIERIRNEFGLRHIAERFRDLYFEVAAHEV